MSGDAWVVRCVPERVDGGDAHAAWRLAKRGGIAGGMAVLRERADAGNTYAAELLPSAVTSRACGWKFSVATWALVF